LNKSSAEDQELVILPFCNCILLSCAALWEKTALLGVTLLVKYIADNT